VAVNRHAASSEVPVLEQHVVKLSADDPDHDAHGEDKETPDELFDVDDDATPWLGEASCRAPLMSPYCDRTASGGMRFDLSQAKI
jgi:hypothetical protein